MGEAGRLGPEVLQVDQREFRVGDQVVCGRNARRRLGVVNGTRGQVTALNATRQSLTIETDEGREVTLPGWYVAGQGFERPWVDHGYAITGHKTQGLSGDDFGVRPSTRADAHWAYVAASRHRFDLRLYLVEELTAPDHDDTRHARDPLDDRVEATLRAMRRPGEQVFAIDQDLAADVRRMSVPELRRERDQLRELLAGAPSSVDYRIALAEERHRQAEQRLAQAEQAAKAAIGGWGGRAWRMLRPTPRPAPGQPGVSMAEAARVADQVARELVDLRRQQQQHAAFLERHQPTAVRYTAIVRELGWHGRATARALELERPTWLTELLGEVPETNRGRRAWRQTAARLQHYRHAYPSSDPERPLGPEPTRDLAQRRAWRACRQAIDRYQRQHRTRDQRHHPADRTRDWTRTRARDRGREREAG
jgi:hypothetical protein